MYALRVRALWLLGLAGLANGCETNEQVTPATTATSSSSSGTGGSAPLCQPGNVEACPYSGPAKTENVGVCRAGAKTCDADGASWGACEGEVVPAPEDCSTPADDACDGAIAPCGASGPFSHSFGDSATMQSPSSIAIDDAANILIAGEYAGSLDFGGGPLASTTGADLFLASFDPAGAHRWSKHVAASVSGPRIAIDGLGDVVIATGVSGSIDFGGGALDGAKMGTDVAVAKLDENGAFSWAKRFAGAPALPSAIAIARTGEIVVAGDFTGTIDLGCGPLVPRSNLVAGSFVAELDASGKCLFSDAFGADLIHTNAVAVGPGGEVWAAGSFETEANFGGVFEGNDLEVKFLFLVKLARDGSFVLDKVFRTEDANGEGGLFVDSNGDVVLTGSIGGGPPVDIDFGNGKLMSAAFSAGFLARFDGAGAARWSMLFGPSPTGSFAVTGASGGGVMVIGAAQGDVDFGGGVATKGAGAFVASFDAKGTATAAHVHANALAIGLAVDGKQNAILAGAFSTSVDFGQGPLTSQGGYDIFLADVGPAPW